MVQKNREPKLHKMHSIHVFDVVNTVLLVLLALICIYPFIYIFFVSTSDGVYLSRGKVTFWPLGFNWESFKYILSNTNFHVFTGLRNSFIYTIAGTAVALFCTYLTAYVLNNPRIKSRNIIARIFVITWVFDAGLIPQYIIYSKFGFVDNPLVMIIPGAISTQFLIICRSFLQGIPKELEEAAEVDGANDFQILSRIYLPLSSTIMATLGVFYAVLIWNQYTLPLIYLKSDNLKTIQQVLKSVVITEGTSSTSFRNIVVGGITLNQQNLKAAATFVAMVPIVLVYPFVQKYFKKGILIGSVKG